MALWIHTEGRFLEFLPLYTADLEAEISTHPELCVANRNAGVMARQERASSTLLRPEYIQEGDGRMQQADAPSHSLGDTLNLKDTARSASLTGWLTPHAAGPAGWSFCVQSGGFLPCCGPCSCMEVRLRLSARVLRSTTLASQPGHSPQPLATGRPQEAMVTGREGAREEG